MTKWTLNSSKGNLRRQDGDDRMERKFCCRVCHAAFWSKRDLQLHSLYKHFTAKKLKCKVCNKYYNGSYVLKNHMHVVHGNFDTPQSCTFCDKSFSNKRALNTHVAHCKLNQNAITWTCVFCDKTFHHLNVLQNHIRVHTRETPFECKLCDKSFGAYDSMYLHFKRHVGERAHKCAECGKDFITPAEMRSHRQMVHRKSLTDSCIFCEKTFHSKYLLWSHTRFVHTLEKWYFCAMCDKEVGSHGEMVLHVRRIHTKERPYKCTWNKCLWTFQTRRGCQDHIKSHERNAEMGKPYVCADCPKTFTTIHHLRRHESNKHGEKISADVNNDKTFGRWKMRVKRGKMAGKPKDKMLVSDELINGVDGLADINMEFQSGGKTSINSSSYVASEISPSSGIDETDGEYEAFTNKLVRGKVSDFSFDKLNILNKCLLSLRQNSGNSK